MSPLTLQVLQTQLQTATAANQLQQQQLLLTTPASQPSISPAGAHTPSSSSSAALLVEEPSSQQQAHHTQQQTQQQQQAVTSLLTAQLASALGIDPVNPNPTQIASAGKVCVCLSTLPPKLLCFLVLDLSLGAV